MGCLTCHGARWICEAHPDRPWPHDDCAGPGDPCPDCNRREPPAWSPGVASIVDVNGSDLSRSPRVHESADENAKLLHTAKPDPPRVPRSGELLFEFLRGHDRIRCELRDHGAYGVEAQFMTNEELTIAHTFHQRLDPNRTPREMAVAWAEEWRKTIESPDAEDRGGDP